MKPVLASLVAVAALAAPALSFASTYKYVDVRGVVASTVANTATEALAFTANISPNSGVMLEMNGSTQAMPDGMFVGS